MITSSASVEEARPQEMSNPMGVGVLEPSPALEGGEEEAITAEAGYGAPIRRVTVLEILRWHEFGNPIGQVICSQVVGSLSIGGSVWGGIQNINSPLLQCFDN